MRGKVQYIHSLGTGSGWYMYKYRMEVVWVTNMMRANFMVQVAAG